MSNFTIYIAFALLIGIIIGAFLSHHICKSYIEKQKLENFKEGNRFFSRFIGIEDYLDTVKNCSNEISDFKKEISNLKYDLNETKKIMDAHHDIFIKKLNEWIIFKGDNLDKDFLNNLEKRIKSLEYNVHTLDNYYKILEKRFERNFKIHTDEKETKDV